MVFFLFKIIDQDYATRIPKKQLKTLPADGTAFAFFGAIHLSGSIVLAVP